MPQFHSCFSPSRVRDCPMTGVQFHPTRYLLSSTIAPQVEKQVETPGPIKRDQRVKIWMADMLKLPQPPNQPTNILSALKSFFHHPETLSFVGHNYVCVTLRFGGSHHLKRKNHVKRRGQLQALKSGKWLSWLVETRKFRKMLCQSLASSVCLRILKTMG